MTPGDFQQPENPRLAERERIIRRLRFLARLLDGAVRFPGTGFRFGLDPLIGLLPGVGDGVSFGMSAYIIYLARKLGVSRWTLLRMIFNALLDAVLGSIPVVGDVFDFAFKANQKNLRLLGIETTERR